MDDPHPPCEHSPRWAGKDGTLWPCADPDCPSSAGVAEVRDESGCYIQVGATDRNGRERWRWHLIGMPLAPGERLVYRLVERDATT